MADDLGIVVRRGTRGARQPSQGSVLSSTSSRSHSFPPSREDALIDDEDNVRRLWTPGDPWNSNFYFGRGEVR